MMIIIGVVEYGLIVKKYSIKSNDNNVLDLKIGYSSHCKTLETSKQFHKID